MSPTPASSAVHRSTSTSVLPAKQLYKAHHRAEPYPQHILHRRRSTSPPASTSTTVILSPPVVAAAAPSQVQSLQLPLPVALPQSAPQQTTFVIYNTNPTQSPQQQTHTLPTHHQQQQQQHVYSIVSATPQAPMTVGQSPYYTVLPVIKTEPQTQHQPPMHQQVQHITSGHQDMHHSATIVHHQQPAAPATTTATVVPVVVDPKHQREIQRKVSHSAIERRRRERINDKILQLKGL
ncbi:hypothetical protein HK102_008666, partial [Quaeritorhiza haematococci]